MKILELFAGIGACSKALERLGINAEIADAVEIDKYAMASFNAIHNTNFQTQDITSYNKDLKDIELITHGSPCQDFSVAGKQAGGDLGSGTRSSLMYETIRIVGKIRPKYVLWENVKNILSKKHKHNFDAYIETMKVLGYNSYYEVLDAKDYGVPQHRERVYTVSIRKDIDKGDFKFPEKEKLKLKLKDMLESEVEEKYYISKALNLKLTNNYIQYSNSGKMQNSQAERAYYKDNEYMCTVSHCNLNGDKTQIVLKNKKDILNNESCRRVYSKEGISPTVFTCQGGNTEPKVMIKNATKKGYDEAIDGDSINLQYPDSKTRRGRVGHQVSQTLMANDSMGVVNNFRIRKLTPKECWRLMRI
jgi:DNA (cytosine-5)-methyltransferase 1